MTIRNVIAKVSYIKRNVIYKVKYYKLVEFNELSLYKDTNRKTQISFLLL